MKKFFLISFIFFLILSTAIIKNSTKRIDDEIFILKENLRSLKKDFKDQKLEYEYLSSAENLFKFKKIYFDYELDAKNIKNIKIINKSDSKIEIKKFKFIYEE